MDNKSTLYLLFPRTHYLLCNIISDYIKTYNFICIKKIYEVSELNSEFMLKLSQDLNQNSILILGHYGNIPSENFYKLGIAFAKNSKIILVSITQSEYLEIPIYVRTDFQVFHNENVDQDLSKNTKKLLLDLKKLIQKCQVSDLITQFFHRAVNYCENIEKRSGKSIRKVSETEFTLKFELFQESQKITTLEQIKGVNQEILNEALMSCIVNDPMQFYEALTMIRNIKYQAQNEKNLSIINIGKADFIGGHKVMENKQFTNNLQGANIANFANEVKDNATQQATHFTQNSGINTAELLDIIKAMRQNLEAFPAESQENIIIDLDDLEAEINKPEGDRRLPRIKKYLTNLATAATMTIATLGAANEATVQLNSFVDNVGTLANKFQIELPMTVPVQNQLPSS